MMSIKQAISENVLWKGLFLLSSLVLNIFIVRFLGPEGSGMLFYLVSIFTLIIQVVSLSLDSGIVYSAATNKIGTTKLAYLALMWTSAVIVLLLGLYFWLRNEQVLKISVSQDLFLYCLAFVGGNLIVLFFTSLFFARLNFKIPSLVGIFTNLVLISIFVLSYRNLTSVQNSSWSFTLFFLSFPIQGLILVILFFLKYQEKREPGFVGLQQLKSLLQYTLVAYVANIIFFLLYRVDYYFVKRFCSLEALGNYIQVSKIGQLCFMLPAIVAGAIFPLSAKMQTEFQPARLIRISRFIFFTFFVLCAFLAATGKFLFPWVFGEGYRKMYVAFLFLIPGILSLSTLYPITAFYSGLNRMPVNIRGSLIALILIIAGDIIFIPRFGINGAAAVSSLGYISSQVYIFCIFSRENNLSFWEIFIPRKTDVDWVKQFIRNKA